ncbi:TIGR01212 family radical SAM protein [Methanothermococcus sp.]|uniref:TIGR01212 family radical SAM protein n=1 Tax=Methanothermococcus sp. TaxID=2614238 RepID=UPI0025E0B757|nr:TIGR01212 family radical SAM protein [Methanothermococcus sp.]
MTEINHNNKKSKNIDINNIDIDKSNINCNKIPSSKNKNIIKTIDKNIIDNIYSDGFPIAQYGLYIKRVKHYKTFKIPVDAGFTCPNKDGTLDTKGCIFCPKMGRPISVKYCNTKYPLKEQIEKQIEKQKNKGIEKFYIYFYPGTNTYGTPNKLKELWDFALSYPDVIGLSIGTRPDCLEDEKLDILEDYVNEGYEIWIDLGIQTMHQRTLNILNRRHKVSDTVRTILECKKRGIFVCGHVILGLPNETWDDMMKTAKILSKLEIDALKIYPLVVIQNTELENLYWRGEYKTLDKKQYIKLVCDFLERLSPYVLIQRLSKDKTPDEIKISPEWNLHRLNILNEVSNELKRRNTKQGVYYQIEKN